MADTTNNHADFTPQMGDYIQLTPFRFWCQKVLPLVYDDSLSYYELLAKVVDYINKTMEDVDVLHGDINELLQAFNQLQNYVNTYFDNLDIQEQINIKLDQMADDGTFDAILLPYFNAYTVDINNRINTQNQTIQAQGDQIVTLSNRMDSYERLPEGSTTGDAELIDIRVGANGVTYNTAGDAVRGQYNDLNSDIEAVENALVFGNMFDASQVIRGGYYSATGAVYVSENSYYSPQYIPIENGVEYQWTPESMMYINTYNSSRTNIRRIDAGTVSHQKLTFNNDEVYVRLSVYNKNFPLGFKFTKSSTFNYVDSSYGYKVNGDKIVDGSIPYYKLDESVQDFLNLAEDVLIFGNMFDKTLIQSGGYYAPSGNIYTEENSYYSTQYIPIEQGVEYRWTHIRDLYINTYDSTRTNITRIEAATLPDKNIFDNGVAYIRFSVYRNQFTDNFKFAKSSIFSLVDSNYGYEVNGEKILDSSIPLDKLAEPVGVKKINVTVDSDRYTFSINDYDVRLLNIVNQSTRSDLWTIDGITKDGLTICPTGTDIIGVLKEVGQSDFMGGIHGDETNFMLNIYADGVPVTENTSGVQIDIFMASHLTRVSTGDNIIDRFVHITLKDNYIEVENTFKCLINGFNLSYAYNGGMFAWLDTDTAFQMSNVGIIDSQGGTEGVTLQTSPSLYTASALVNGYLIQAENVIGKDSAGYLGETYYYGSSNKRIKMYYATEHDVTWNTGHICKGKSKYTLV